MEILEGNREPELHPVALKPVLQSEIKTSQSAHSAATITVNGELSETLQVSATNLLSSVFRHLLNNAVTHNNKSSPEITVEVDVSPDTVEVSVADNGPGVPDSQKTEIFGRGEMGAESQGSGIGLYLVDTLVEMYDGTVTIADRDEWVSEPDVEAAPRTSIRPDSR